MLRATAAISLALGAAAPAVADVLVEFSEGAPKDRFTITGLATCPLGRADVMIDLSGWTAGLIFDVTGSGAGVEVFQPFENVSSTADLIKATDVRDGDTRISLTLRDITQGVSVAFTIDVDDTAGTRETVVSGSEILGATVSVASGAGTQTGVFGQDGTALVKIDGCLS